MDLFSGECYPALVPHGNRWQTEQQGVRTQGINEAASDESDCDLRYQETEASRKSWLFSIDRGKKTDNDKNIFSFSLFIYFERDRDGVSGGGAEREKKRERVSSRPLTVSVEPDWRLDHEVMT